MSLDCYEAKSLRIHSDNLALGLFAVMDVLISNDLDYEKPNKSRAYLNFIRLDPADTVTNTKDRRIPEPPPPQDMPETPDFSAAVDPLTHRFQ